MISGQCVLCIKRESDYIASKVTKKELSHKEAAVELDVPLQEWIAHYELHVRQKLISSIALDVEPIKNILLDKIKEGTKSMDGLIKLTNKILAELEKEDAIKNLRLIQTYAQLQKNVITGLKELAILEGDINQATTINIQNNTIKVEKLMSIVMEDAPPELKKIILKKLESVEV